MPNCTAPPSPEPIYLQCSQLSQYCTGTYQQGTDPHSTCICTCPDNCTGDAINTQCLPCAQDPCTVNGVPNSCSFIVETTINIDA